MSQEICKVNYLKFLKQNTALNVIGEYLQEMINYTGISDIYPNTGHWIVYALNASVCEMWESKL